MFLAVYRPILLILAVMFWSGFVPVITSASLTPPDAEVEEKNCNIGDDEVYISPDKKYGYYKRTSDGETTIEESLRLTACYEVCDSYEGLKVKACIDKAKGELNNDNSTNKDNTDDTDSTDNDREEIDLDKLKEDLEKATAGDPDFFGETAEDSTKTINEVAREQGLDDLVKQYEMQANEAPGQQYGDTYSGPRGVPSTGLNQASRNAAITRAGYNAPSVWATKEEIAFMAKVAELESRSIKNSNGKPNTAAMLGVMDVVRNRVLSPDFPNTVTGVLMQQNAFTPVKDGLHLTGGPPDQSTVDMATAVLNGETVPIAVNEDGQGMLNFGNVPHILNSNRASSRTKSSFNAMFNDSSSITFTDARNPNTQHTFGTLARRDGSYPQAPNFTTTDTHSNPYDKVAYGNTGQTSPYKPGSVRVPTARPSTPTNLPQRVFQGAANTLGLPSTPGSFINSVMGTPGNATNPGTGLLGALSGIFQPNNQSSGQSQGQSPYNQGYGSQAGYGQQSPYNQGYGGQSGSHLANTVSPHSAVVTNHLEKLVERLKRQLAGEDIDDEEEEEEEDETDTSTSTPPDRPFVDDTPGNTYIPITITIDDQTGEVRISHDYLEQLLQSGAAEVPGYGPLASELPTLNATTSSDIPSLVFNDAHELVYSDGLYAPPTITGLSVFAEESAPTYVYFIEHLNRNGQVTDTISTTELPTRFTRKALSELFDTPVDPDEVTLEDGEIALLNKRESRQVDNIFTRTAKALKAIFAPELAAPTADAPVTTSPPSEPEETGLYTAENIERIYIYPDVEVSCPRVPGLSRGYVYELMMLELDGTNRGRIVTAARCGSGDSNMVIDAIINHMIAVYDFAPIERSEVIDKIFVVPGIYEHEAGVIEYERPSVYEPLPLTGSLSNTTNTITFEVTASDEEGAILVDWTTENLQINEAAELYFRWQATDYEQCQVYLNDGGEYRDTRADNPALTTGNTATEGYDVPESTATYRIECSGQYNGESGVDVREVRVTMVYSG